MISSKTIQGCIKNDRLCQKQLYQDCAPYVYAIVKSYVVDEGYIKDVMQDAFASIFSSIHNYDQNKGSFKSWVSRIVTFRAIDFLKINNKVKFNTELEVLDRFSEDSFRHLDSLTKDDIDNLLSDMPEGYKTIFMLSVIDEYTHKEIGGLLAISPETSRSQLHRAMKWLKNNINFTSNQMRI